MFVATTGRDGPMLRAERAAQGEDALLRRLGTPGPRVFALLPLLVLIAARWAICGLEVSQSPARSSAQPSVFFDRYIRGG